MYLSLSNHEKCQMQYTSRITWIFKLSCRSSSPTTTPISLTIGLAPSVAVWLDSIAGVWLRAMWNEWRRYGIPYSDPISIFRLHHVTEIKSGNERLCRRLLESAATGGRRWLSKTGGMFWVNGSYFRVDWKAQKGRPDISNEDKITDNKDRWTNETKRNER